jgi:hypothetical protein
VQGLERERLRLIGLVAAQVLHHQLAAPCSALALPVGSNLVLQPYCRYELPVRFNSLMLQRRIEGGPCINRWAAAILLLRVSTVKQLYWKTAYRMELPP